MSGIDERYLSRDFRYISTLSLSRIYWRIERIGGNDEPIFEGDTIGVLYSIIIHSIFNTD
jgi:hypothetical protein